MYVPIQCEECGEPYMDYQYQLEYSPAFGNSRITHRLFCPVCRYQQRLFIPAVLFERDGDDGIDAIPIQPNPKGGDEDGQKEG